MSVDDRSWTPASKPAVDLKQAPGSWGTSPWQAMPDVEGGSESTANSWRTGPGAMHHILRQEVAQYGPMPGCLKEQMLLSH